MAALILNVTELPLDVAYKLGLLAKAVPAIANKDKTKPASASFVTKLFFTPLDIFMFLY